LKPLVSASECAAKVRVSRLRCQSPETGFRKEEE
jgi:hypothetical protein